MTLPKGFGSGGGGGTSSADVERMIGKRVENMTGMITISFMGSMVGNFWWYCSRILLLSMGISNKSGHFAFIVLTIIEAIGYIFCVKVMEEGSNKNSNGIVGSSIAGSTAVLFYHLFVRW